MNDRAPLDHDDVDHLIGLVLDFLAGAAFVVVLVALGFFTT